MTESGVPKTPRRRVGGAGRLWLVLIFFPALLVLGGVVAMFAWQGSKGGISPKWRKAPVTNAPPSASRGAVPEVPKQP